MIHELVCAIRLFDESSAFDCKQSGILYDSDYGLAHIHRNEFATGVVLHIGTSSMILRASESAIAHVAQPQATLSKLIEERDAVYAANHRLAESNEQLLHELASLRNDNSSSSNASELLASQEAEIKDLQIANRELTLSSHQLEIQLAEAVECIAKAKSELHESNQTLETMKEQLSDARETQDQYASIDLRLSSLMQSQNSNQDRWHRDSLRRNANPEQTTADSNDIASQISELQTAISGLSNEVAKLTKARNSESRNTKATSKPRRRDDLTRIEGIGSTICDLLAAKRITTFNALAKTKVSRLIKILHDGGPKFSMHVPDSWPHQAELAREAKWDELAKLQDHLVCGREPSS